MSMYWCIPFSKHPFIYHSILWLLKTKGYYSCILCIRVGFNPITETYLLKWLITYLRALFYFHLNFHFTLKEMHQGASCTSCFILILKGLTCYMCDCWLHMSVYIGINVYQQAVSHTLMCTTETTPKPWSEQSDPSLHIRKCSTPTRITWVG